MKQMRGYSSSVVITAISFSILLFLHPIHHSLYAQITPGMIKGKVLNGINRTPVASANIVIIDTELGAASDLDGEFIITGIKPGTYHVQASALGFAQQTQSEVSVLPGRAVEIEFQLEPTSITSEEVTVRSGYFRHNPDLPTSSRSLSYEEIRRAPGAVEDIQRAVQALPGVVNSNDQTNEIVVRGGSPYENLTVIDGIEIDNINHFPEYSSSGGPISAINQEFVRDVSFATGGFAARYGDRLSSVLHLDLRDGDREQFSGQAELSMGGGRRKF